MNLPLLGPERGPELRVLRAPLEQLGVGVAARIDVDEQRSLRVESEGKPEGEVPFPAQSVSGIVAAGEQPSRESRGLQGGQLFHFGGPPRLVRVFEDVIEREEPADPDPGRGGAGMGDVLHAQRPVEPAAGNAADPGGGGKAVERFLDAVAAAEEAADEPQGPVAPAVEVGAELGPGEPAAVAADQDDPLGLPAAPAEGFQLEFAAAKMTEAPRPLRQGRRERPLGSRPSAWVQTSKRPRLPWGGGLGFGARRDANPGPVRWGASLSCLQGPAPSDQEVTHLLGVAGGLQDLPGIAFDHPDPAGEVDVPVAWGMAHAHPDAGEQGADLGAQFFPSVRLRVEARLPSLVQGGPVEALGVAGGVSEFMKRGPIVGSGVGKLVPRRHGDAVVLQAVVSPIAALVMKFDAAGADHPLGIIMGLPGRPTLRERRELEAVGLLDVEDDMALESRSAPAHPLIDLFAVFILDEAPLVVLDGLLVVPPDVQDGGAFFALANEATGGPDLSAGSPAVVRISSRAGNGREVEAVGAPVLG